MITVTPLDLHWVTDLPSTTDLCAHGRVQVAVDGGIVLDSGYGVTVSAGALLLLRSLELDHTPEHPLGDRIIPCCGHLMSIDQASGEVMIIDCEGSGGADWWIRHDGNQVGLSFPSGRQIVVSIREWQTAVLGFAKAVSDFYAASAPKQPAAVEELVPGAYETFWKEWRRRTNAARSDLET